MIIEITQGMIMEFVLWFRTNAHIYGMFLGVIFFTTVLSILGILISVKKPAPVTPFSRWLIHYVRF